MSILTPQESEQAFRETNAKEWIKWMAYVVREASAFVACNPVGGMFECYDGSGNKGRSVFASKQALLALEAKGWHVRFMKMKKCGSGKTLLFNISTKPFPPTFWERIKAMLRRDNGSTQSSDG